MPEPSASDLKRLGRLESKLGKAETSAKAAQVELRTLRASAKAQTTRADQAEAQNAALREENQRLADELAESARERDQAGALATAARTRAETAEARAAKAEAEAAKAIKAADAAVGEKGRFEKRVGLLDAQVRQEKGTEPVVSPDDVAHLVDDLVVRLGGGMRHFQVHDGEIKLNVAFAKLGDERAFVVPSADGKPIDSKAVHELSFRFGRTPEEA